MVCRFGRVASDSQARCDVRKFVASPGLASRASLVLDLKRYNCLAVDFDPELRSDRMPATWTAWKKRNPLGRKMIDVDAVKQRLPLHLARRAIKDNDAAV